MPQERRRSLQDLESVDGKPEAFRTEGGKAALERRVAGATAALPVTRALAFRQSPHPNETAIIGG